MVELNSNGGKGFKLSLNVSLGQILVLVGLIGSVIKVMLYIGGLETRININSERLSTVKESVRELQRAEQRLENRLDGKTYGPSYGPYPQQ